MTLTTMITDFLEDRYKFTHTVLWAPGPGERAHCIMEREARCVLLCQLTRSLDLFIQQMLADLCAHLGKLNTHSIAEES